jgi:hypothetical protein
MDQIWKILSMNHPFIENSFIHQLRVNAGYGDRGFIIDRIFYEPAQ